VVSLIRMDILSVVTTTKEMASVALGHGDGVGEEEVVEPLCPQRESPRPDEDILRLRIWVASASMSPAELRPIEGPLELHEVGMDLSPAESVVGDGIRVATDPAGRGDGGGNGLTAGRHSDDWLMRVVVVVMVRLLSEGDGGLPLHTPPLIYLLTLHIGPPTGLTDHTRLTRSLP
jgi:hypothetical protein